MQLFHWMLEQSLTRLRLSICVSKLLISCSYSECCWNAIFLVCSKLWFCSSTFSRFAFVLANSSESTSPTYAKVTNLLHLTIPGPYGHEL